MAKYREKYVKNCGKYKNGLNRIKKINDKNQKWQKKIKNKVCVGQKIKQKLAYVVENEARIYLNNGREFIKK